MKKIFSFILLMVGIPMVYVSAATIINPGTTSNFAILAGSTITNTGSTVISGSGGDIGLYPGTSFINQVGVTTSGEIYINNSVANIAKNDLVTVYNKTSGALPVTRIASQLGGQTLTPGIYDSADGTFQITGTLTLNGQDNPNAVFIFKSASTLITASGSQVRLINDANYCQILWKVGSSATLGTNSDFAGRLYVMQSITATTGAKVRGQLLARNGAVTLDTNTITNTNCSAVTIAGGQLPNTGTNLYQILILGIMLVIFGLSTLIITKYNAVKKDSIY